MMWKHTKLILSLTIATKRDCKSQRSKQYLYGPKQTTLKQVPTYINATFEGGEGN